MPRGQTWRYLGAIFVFCLSFIFANLRFLLCKNKTGPPGSGDWPDTSGKPMKYAIQWYQFFTAPNITAPLIYENVKYEACKSKIGHV